MLLILYNIFQPPSSSGVQGCMARHFPTFLSFRGTRQTRIFDSLPPAPGVHSGQELSHPFLLSGVHGGQECSNPLPLSGVHGGQEFANPLFPFQGYTAGKNFPTPFPLQGYTAGKIVQPNSPFRDTRRARIRPRWMKFSENLNQIFAFSLTKTCPLLSSFKTVIDGTLFVRIPFGSYKF